MTSRARRVAVATLAVGALVGCTGQEAKPVAAVAVAEQKPVGPTDLQMEQERMAADALAAAEAARVAAEAEAARVAAEQAAAAEAARRAAEQAAAAKAAAEQAARAKAAKAVDPVAEASRKLAAATGMTSVHPEECKIVLAEDGGGPMYDYCKAVSR